MTEQWSDWIAWGGGECPIPWAKAGEWVFASRDNNAFNTLCMAKEWDWTDNGGPFDITAYRYRLDAAPKPRERTVYTDGDLDECVVYGSAHLERLDGDMWHLSMVREDGSELAVTFTGRVSVEERKAK